MECAKIYVDSEFRHTEYPHDPKTVLDAGGRVVYTGHERPSDMDPRSTFIQVPPELTENAREDFITRRITGEYARAKEDKVALLVVHTLHTKPLQNRTDISRYWTKLLQVDMSKPIFGPTPPLLDRLHLAHGEHDVKGSDK
jgi:hypothetical protein